MAKSKRVRPPDDFLRKWLGEVKKDWNELIHEAGFPPGSEFERAAHLIFYGFASQDSRNIHRFTGWDMGWIRECRERARQAGIWQGNCRLCVTWLDQPKDDKDATLKMVEFITDVMIVAGHMEKIVPKMATWNGTKYVREAKYRLTPKGVEHARRVEQAETPLPRPTRLELARFADDGNPNC